MRPSINENVQQGTSILCSIIFPAGANATKTNSYLLSLSKANLPDDYELIVLNNQALLIDEKQLQENLPRLKILNIRGPLRREQLFESGAVMATGKYLLFIRDLIDFDVMVLQESIKDLEISGGKISVSANNFFILCERRHYACISRFESLFGSSNNVSNKSGPLTTKLPVGKQPPPNQPFFITREQRFNEKGRSPNLTLTDILTSPALELVTDNPYSVMSRDQVISKILSERRWRWHHDIEQLKSPDFLYTAYADRVETLLRMIDTALDTEGLTDQLDNMTAADIAAAESFVGMHYFAKGLKQIDSFELNRGQIKRCQMVQRLKQLDEDADFSKFFLYRLDLESPNWSTALSKKYDLVFCLGIVYHMENPMIFLRNIYEITENLCIVESDTPLLPKTDLGILKQQDSQVTLEQGNVRYILEQRPNRKALIDMLLAVGFSSVRTIPCPSDASCSYLRTGTKSVLVARK